MSGPDGRQQQRATAMAQPTRPLRPLSSRSISTSRTRTASAASSSSRSSSASSGTRAGGTGGADPTTSSLPIPGLASSSSYHSSPPSSSSSFPSSLSPAGDACLPSRPRPHSAGPLSLDLLPPVSSAASSPSSSPSSASPGRGHRCSDGGSGGAKKMALARSFNRHPGGGAGGAGSRLCPRSCCFPVPRWLTRWIRREALAIVAEFFGTFSFLFLAFYATQLLLGVGHWRDFGRIGTSWLDYQSVILISLAWGGSAAFNLWLFNPLSGGMFNPVITLALVLAGTIHPLRGIILVPTHFAASIAAASLTARLLPGTLFISNSISGLLPTTEGWFVEMLLTAQLVFSAYLLVGAGRKQNQAGGGSLAVPIGMGFSIFLAHLAAVNLTGAGMNPARSLACDIVTRRFEGEFWVFYGAPPAGGAIAFIVYLSLGYIEGRVCGDHDGLCGGGDRDVEYGPVDTPLPNELVSAGPVQLREPTERRGWLGWSGW